MCCMQPAENTGRKNNAKNRRLGTTAQFCWAISSQLRHVSTNGKNLVKQQYLLQMSAQYGELQPTSSWDLLASLGHPSKFHQVSRLCSLIARHSSIGHQPNFAALNTGRHLYLAGRPSRWALAHILVNNFFRLSILYVPYLRRYSPTKLWDDAQMANFWRFLHPVFFSEPHAARFRPAS